MEDAITDWLSSYGVIAVFLLMAMNGSLSAPPSELILSYTGILIAKGVLPLPQAVIASVLGNWVGACVLYVIGRQFGEHVILATRNKLTKLPYGLRFLAKALPTRQTIDHYSRRHNSVFPWWILYCRCLPIIRSVISIPAGISRVPFLVFSLLTATGAFFWTIVWTSLGYCSENQHTFGQGASYTLLALFGLLLLFLLRTLHGYMSNKRTQCAE